MAKQGKTQNSVPTDGNTAVICFPSYGDLEENVHWILSEGHQRGWYPITISHATNESSVQESEHILLNGYQSKTKECNVLRDQHLLNRLKTRKIQRLVLCGGHTNHEVASTARSGVKHGFDVVVIADTMSPGETRSVDGTCPPPQDVHAITLATLEQIGAVVTTVDGVLTESYKSAVGDAVAELYTDAVGESDFIESDPLPLPLIRPTAALVVVNICDEYAAPEFGYRNNNEAEELVERLVDRWRSTGREVLHTRHPPSMLQQDFVLQGTTVAPQESEIVVEARTQDAFYQTELDNDLKSRGVDQLVFVGLPMQGAVAETARVALELGYEVIIVEDATAGYDFSIDTGCTVAGTEVHWIELASLASLGCLVTDTEFTTQNL